MLVKILRIIINDEAWQKKCGIDKRDAFKKLFKIGLCDTGSVIIN